jgi:peptidoglycan/xylan/chitin deacetylase (PgdA/CDA1 family)
MKRAMAGVLGALTLLFPGGAGAREHREAPHAVVFIYHHFGDDRYPSTNIRMEQFDAQLGYLEEYGYRVWPLSRIVRHLAEGRPLPVKTVALTMDDAYATVYTHAYPRLKKRDWPMTVFVNTDPVDKGFSNFMSWDQMREMQRHGAEFANHSAAHDAMRCQKGELREACRRRLVRGIAKAQRRLQEELGAKCNEAPRLFAYPFGAYSGEGAQLLRELGYVGITQTSGPVGMSSDLRALPRFPMAEAFADLEGFVTKLKTVPMPVVEVRPFEPVITGENPPRLSFELEYPVEGVQCYLADGEPLEVRQEGATSYRVRARSALGPPRNRYSCTAPAGEGRWYWYSHPWIVE